MGFRSADFPVSLCGVKLTSVVSWLRFLSLLIAVVGGVMLIFSENYLNPLGYLALAVFTLLIWLLTLMAVDMRGVREALEAPETGMPDLQGRGVSQHNGVKDVSQVLLEMVSRKRLGDRIFKADGTKTCRNCKSFREDEVICSLDGASLVGITISAVGCQHWQPALKVTETSGPDSSLETPPDLDKQ